jgi:4'-phosphopantetheinyl transferase
VSAAAPVAAVEVLVGRTDAPDALDRSLLSPSEDGRYRRFTRDGPRRRFLAGRSLLRRVIAERSGTTAGSVDLRTLEDGRPSCDAFAGLSLSHSGDLVACALADHPVGIDLQITSTGHDVAAIAAARFFSAESEWLDGQPREAFYDLWVLKEAFLKATGVGLAGGLDTLRCGVTPPRLQLSVEDGTQVAAALFHLPGAALAVVVPGVSGLQLSCQWAEGAADPPAEIARTGSHAGPC